jgi:hypothetical protein
MPAFRYIRHTQNENGLRETVTREFAQPDILIGRGAAADIRIIGRSVGLEHARVRVGEGTLRIEDLGSLGGVSVNERPVGSSQLREGDTVGIGSFSFKVVHADGVWGFAEERGPEHADDDADAIVAKQHETLLVRTHLPSNGVLSTLFCAMMAAVLLGLGWSGWGKTFWDSGPLSHDHAMFAHACDTCHRAPSRRIADDACLSCHTPRR